jgi:hypothetical protein
LPCSLVEFLQRFDPATTASIVAFESADDAREASLLFVALASFLADLREIVVN